MSIVLISKNPGALLEAIRHSIDLKIIDTWAYDPEGDFRHTPIKWRGKAWMRPILGNGRITVGIIGPKDVHLSKLTYGTFHSHFLEMILIHFDRHFDEAIVTSFESASDNFL